MGWRPRVLHVFRSYFPDTEGGIERVIEHLSAATARRGVRNHLFALSPAPAPRPFRRRHLVIHQRRRHLELASCSMSLTTPGAFRRLAARADLIHYHFPWPFADLLHLTAGVNRPALVTYHSDIVRQRRLEPLYRPLMWGFLRRMGAVVATSPEYAASSPVLRSLGSRRVDVIPIGLDEPDEPAPDAGRVAEWRSRVGEGFFLFVGVLRYYKGLHVLLEALREHPHRVVIVGNGPMEATLRRQAAALGVADRITFTGYLPDADKRALLALCRALVFPSHQRSEAYGVSLVEAAMAGRPMVTTAIGTGTTYVNRHERTGLVVPPEDPQALGQALDRLAAQPRQAAAFGAAARRHYRESLTAEQSARAYCDLYARLLQPAAGIGTAAVASEQYFLKG